MIYAIAAIAGIVVILLALRVWAAQKAKAKLRPAKPLASGMIYQTNASDIDKYVVGAEDMWPHLKLMPLFWVASFGTAILLGLDYHFGFQRAGWAGLAVIGSLFALADIAIPFLSLEGDVKARRSPANWFLLCLCTFMTVIVVIGSTAEISTVSGAKADVAVINFADTQKLLAQKQGERDSIKIDRGAEALEGLAKETAAAADRESGRTRCGEKCETLKREAKDYRARADEAARKERLTGEIEALKAKLSGGSSTDQRLDSDAMASNIEGMTGGVVTRDAVRRYGLTVLGVLIVICLTVLWVVVGGNLKSEIEWELAHRGEIADATRASLGMPAKYTKPEVLGLLTGPTTTAVDDGIVINIAAQDMRKRYANDEQLLETDGLFDTLLLKGDGGSVTIAALYKAYQVARLTSDPNSRYMTLPTMAAKLFVIAQNRDDVRVTSDGIIQGWTLKPAAGRTQETPNAA